MGKGSQKAWECIRQKERSVEVESGGGLNRVAWMRQHPTCQTGRFGQYCGRMSVAARKVAEVLALPEKDRAFLARELIASLDDTVDADAETQWREVIDRRSREIEQSKVTCRPVEQVVKGIRRKLHARRQPS
jgi:putative addiction module component (TIGR02574 family)